MTGSLEAERRRKIAHAVVSDVPLIDIVAFLSGQPEGRERVVTQVQRACEEIGFFSIVGHGVGDQLMADIRSTSNRFFDLPLEQKLMVKRAQSSFFRSQTMTLRSAALINTPAQPPLPSTHRRRRAPIGTVRMPKRAKARTAAEPITRDN
jgi:isopenicillin N synthase-like dioxygenase